MVDDGSGPQWQQLLVIAAVVDNCIGRWQQRSMMAGKMAADNSVRQWRRAATAGDWQQCRTAADNGSSWEGARKRMMVALQCRAAADYDPVVLGGGQQWQQREG